jgi:hypothetical protein
MKGIPVNKTPAHYVVLAHQKDLAVTGVELQQDTHVLLQVAYADMKDANTAIMQQLELMKSNQVAGTVFVPVISFSPTIPHFSFFSLISLTLSLSLLLLFLSLPTSLSPCPPPSSFVVSRFLPMKLVCDPLLRCRCYGHANACVYMGLTIPRLNANRVWQTTLPLWRSCRV